MRMTWEVLTPRPLHDAAHEILDPFANVTVGDEYESDTALEADLNRFDAIVLKSLPLSRERLERATNLKVVTQSGVGLDPVDIPAATEFGVIVCNNPGANTRAVAEYTLASVLALRRSLRQADSDVRNGVWEKHGYLAGELGDDVLGVFGCGDIGSMVTEFAQGFGMTCCAYDPYQHAENLPDGVEKVESVGALFESADVVCIHAPLTSETRGAVGEAELDALGSDGILVNAARGPIVDEDALVAALETSSIDGAGIDVFVEEPVPADHPLLELENVLVSPHMAGSTTVSVPAKDRGAAENIKTVYEGRVPMSSVNVNEMALWAAFDGDVPVEQGSPGF